MGFGDNSIGFFLQAENQLTPELKSASVSYKKFVTDIEKWNKRAYKSASSGFGQLEELTMAFAKLPKEASKGYEQALKNIAKRTKPIMAPLDLVLSTKSETQLRKQFSKSVSDAMSGAKMRFKASMPKSRLGMFDTSASLRTLYGGLPQPPDMIGKMPPLKFAEGGVVPGAGGGSGVIDSVRSLLTPGELVLPPDLAAALTDVAQASEKIGTLEDVISAGLGSKSDIKTYNSEVEKLAKSISRVHQESSDLSLTAKQRMAPAIKDATARLEGLTQEAGKTETVMESLLRGVMGPARFLAISKGMDGIAESFRDLTGNASSTFTTIGGDEIGDATDNLNSLNKKLGLTRDGLREVKAASRDQLEAIGGSSVSYDQFTAAMVVATDAGVTNRKMMLDLASVASLSAEGYGLAADSVTAFGFDLQDSMGLASDQFAGVIATLGSLGLRTNGFSTNAEESLERVVSTTKEMGAAFRALSSEDAVGVTNSLARMDAALTTTFIDSAPIMEVFAQAMNGVPEAMGRAQLLTGLGMKDLTDQMVKGDLEGLFAAVATQVDGLDPTALRILGETFGVAGGDLEKFGKNQAGLNQLLIDSEKFVVGQAAAMGMMSERATDNKSTFQQWRTEIGNTLATSEVFGISIGEVIDTTKEFNASTLLSLGFVGKLGIGMLSAGGKAIKFGSNLTGLTGLLSKMPKIGGMFGGGKAAASAVTSIGSAGASAAGAGGFFASIAAGLTTLAGGLTTFGVAMVGPGGIGLAAIVLALIGIAAAARVAAPVFEVMGKVLMHMVDGFVEMFKHALNADPKNLLLMGPAMLAGAVGVSAMAVSVGLYGLAMGTAAVGVAAFSVASGVTGGLSSGVVVSTMETLIGGLRPLSKKNKELEEVNKTMGMVVSFLADFAVVGIALAALGAGAVIGGTVTKVLGFFGVRSPMQQLADGSGDMADTIIQMVTNFEKLAQFGEGRMGAIARIMGDMVGFMGDYAMLATQIENMPGVGVFDRIGDSITGFFGADSPAEKIAAQAGPIAASMQKLMSRFEGAGGLRQSGPQNALSESQIESAISAVVTRDADDRLHTDLTEQTSLLKQMLEVLMATQANGDRPQPSMRPQQGPRRGSNGISNSIAGFQV